MSIASKAVTTATVTSLVMGGLWYAQPRSADEVNRQRQEEMVGQLSDSHEDAKAGQRRIGEEAGRALREDRDRPSEHRPARPRLRLRLP